jgi:hypothetical protein
MPGGPLQVINAMNTIVCSACPKPQPLMVTMQQNVFASDQLCATIEDRAPAVNILPFGPCALTPAPPSPSGGPCVPKTAPTWLPGSSTTTYDGIPALRVTDTLQCLTGGTIKVMQPGQPELTVE